MDYLTEAVDTRGWTVKKDETVSMSFLNHMALNVSFDEIDVSLAAQTRPQIFTDKAKLKKITKDCSHQWAPPYQTCRSLWPVIPNFDIIHLGLHYCWRMYTSTGPPNLANALVLNKKKGSFGDGRKNRFLWWWHRVKCQHLLCLSLPSCLQTIIFC